MMPKIGLQTIAPLLGPLMRWRNHSALTDLATQSDAAQRLIAAHRKARQTARSAGSPFVRAIEVERAKLMRRTDRLVDGSLETHAPWDGETTVAEACEASRTPKHAAYLYGLIRALKPRKVLELGTNVGISGAYIAAALKDNGDGGKLVTMDASAYRQRVAKSVMESVGLDNVEFVMGNFDDTFDPTMASEATFDFAFIDGNHHLEPTLKYVDSLCRAAEGRVDLLLDDIRWSAGMIDAWKQVQVDPRLDVGIDLYNIAICSMKPEEATQRVVSQPLRGEFV